MFKILRRTDVRSRTSSSSELRSSGHPPVLPTDASTRPTENCDPRNSAGAADAPKSYGFVENKHICPVCQKTFPKEHGLILHKNLHYMEKPHRCSKCQATFQSNWLLKKHQNVAHHLPKSLYDPRPFKCLECKIAFRTRGHLAKHARSKLHSQKLSSAAARNKILQDASDSETNEREEEAVGREAWTTSNASVVSFVSEDVRPSAYLLLHEGPAAAIRSTVHHSTRPPDAETSSLSDKEILRFSESKHFTEMHASTNSCLGGTRNKFESHRMQGDAADEDVLPKFQVHGNNCATAEAFARPKKLSLIGKSHCCDTFYADQSYGEKIASDPHEFVANSRDITKTFVEDAVEVPRYLVPPNSQPGAFRPASPASKCSKCSAQFQNLSSLLRHYESHLEQRVHICSICDAGFKAAESLDAHLALHSKKSCQPQATQTCSDQQPMACHACPERCGPRPKAATPRANPASNVPAETLAAFGGCNVPVGVGSANRLPQSSPTLPHLQANANKIVSFLSQNCVASSSHHVASNPHSSSRRGDVQTNVDVPLAGASASKIFSLPDERHLSSGLSPHLFLQPIANAPLLPNGAYLLPGPEAARGDGAGNVQDFYIYNPAGGYFLVASARSLVDSVVPMAKSFSALPISVTGSKPV